MNHDHFPRHPPPDPRKWRAMRGRFFWRFGAFFVFLFFFVSTACALAFWIVSGLLDRLDSPRDPRGLIVAFILIVIGLGIVLRVIRRVALPVGDIVQAAARVEVRAVVRAFNSMAERLQENDEQRRRMLADIAHDLRTPLTVIQGNLEGLLDDVYPRDNAHLQPILDETRMLARLIDDVRTLALAESGALQLQKEPTDVATLTRETVASLRAQADVAGIALEIETTCEVTLALDPARIRQVLENLIANALRYTPRAGTIRVACLAENSGVTISIRDTGAGIAPDDLPRIFDRLYKSRDSGGAGLGLAIAKNLVAAHGGEISAQSELGKGTTIRFLLPRA
ncbi:MAG: HAMP domain-containing histidine kinase [Chloroflexi bacterium]|nr:HAMP domain-containing histidine kinase [Chloroflexota bacterium]